MEKLYYNYNFGIGFNDKDSKKQELSTEEIKKIIENLTVKILGFGTLSELKTGVYTHEDGTVISENSIEVNRKTDGLNAEIVSKFVKGLKKALNQESILVSYTRERVNFA